MKYILFAIFLLISTLSFSQVRKGIYGSEGYLLLKYDLTLNSYFTKKNNQLKLLVILEKEKISYTGSIELSSEITYSGVSGDDESFIYFTPSTKIYIQRELEYWMIFHDYNKSTCVYESVLYLKDIIYLGRPVYLDLFEEFEYDIDPDIFKEIFMR